MRRVRGWWRALDDSTSTTSLSAAAVVSPRSRFLLWCWPAAAAARAHAAAAPPPCKAQQGAVRMGQGGWALPPGEQHVWLATTQVSASHSMLSMHAAYALGHSTIARRTVPSTADRSLLPPANAAAGLSWSSQLLWLAKSTIQAPSTWLGRAPVRARCLCFLLCCCCCCSCCWLATGCVARSRRSSDFPPSVIVLFGRPGVARMGRESDGGVLMAL
jgi:hypothetical protein